MIADSHNEQLAIFHFSLDQLLARIGLRDQNINNNNNYYSFELPIPINLTFKSSVSVLFFPKTQLFNKKLVKLGICGSCRIPRDSTFPE